MEYLTWMPALNVIESLLRILAYMTLISVGWKLFQALSIYVHRNMK
ncbi:MULTISPECIES: hypothetical protein [Acutalibacteraceae]|nr:MULTISPECIES: hypothetical protein [Acutalibacteraceae]